MMPALWRTIQAQTAWPGKTPGDVRRRRRSARRCAFVGLCVTAGPGDRDLRRADGDAGRLHGSPSPTSSCRGQFGREADGLPVPRDLDRARRGGRDRGGLPRCCRTCSRSPRRGRGDPAFALYLVLLLRLRVIPEHHWPALEPDGASATQRAGRTANPPARGMRALDARRPRAPACRCDDAAAAGGATAGAGVSEKPPAREKANGTSRRTEGASLVRAMRGVGARAAPR